MIARRANIEVPAPRIAVWIAKLTTLGYGPETTDAHQAGELNVS